MARFDTNPADKQIERLAWYDDLTISGILFSSFFFCCVPTSGLETRLLNRSLKDDSAQREKRIDAFRAFGLGLADAHVIRNCGG